MDELDGTLTLRHPSQERERLDVIVAECLHSLCGVGLDEACVAMGKVKDKLVAVCSTPPITAFAWPRSHWA